jgi:adenylylsulfate kinase
MTLRIGTIVWLTGLPSSGKSTLAARVADALRVRGHEAIAVLDGDAVRAAIEPPRGYDDTGRDAFYETLARLAALLAAQGLDVLVPATAHKREHRARARALAPGEFVEVFLDTPLERCRERDAKGLYAAAVGGAASAVPGADAPYEVPEAPDEIVREHDRDGFTRLLSRFLGRPAPDAPDAPR